MADCVLAEFFFGQITDIVGPEVPSAAVHCAVPSLQQGGRLDVCLLKAKGVWGRQKQKRPLVNRHLSSAGNIEMHFRRPTNENSFSETKHWFTWKSKVSSQLNTNTNRPSWWPRAFTDSVFPVPAGPEIKENHDKGTISNNRTEGINIEIFAQFSTSMNQPCSTAPSDKTDPFLLTIRTNLIQNTAPAMLTTLLQPCPQHSSNHAQYASSPACNPVPVLLKTLLQLCSQYRSNPTHLHD